MNNETTLPDPEQTFEQGKSFIKEVKTSFTKFNDEIMNSITGMEKELQQLDKKIIKMAEDSGITKEQLEKGAITIEKEEEN
ncbi:hypothetical protein M0813_27132 [Anaeramoeba flamelloides]|uniref:Uncharacterized protein n=1 Tax=Anaeramoeba flamelloides TaxID=1746091 RepID=A0AAV7ZZ57_9EUKA|nr:hypothetical protein M0812_07497 [Anaeramoeba flamelloides]KAJ6237570.1 hypothetical protein M0813_27132 [Anaeramoeba flamelloides]